MANKGVLLKEEVGFKADITNNKKTVKTKKETTQTKKTTKK